MFDAQFVLVTFTVALCVISPTIQLQQINIGALFFENEIGIEKSFENAIQRINTEPENSFRLFPIIRRLAESDSSIALQREACDLIDSGVVAIFGPSSKGDSDIVSLTCNSTGIPHILFDLSNQDDAEEKIKYQTTVNVFPNQLILSKAYADIVNNFGWRKFTIVYDADDVQAPMRLQDLLQLRDVHNDVVKVRKFRRTDDLRLMWKNMKGERRIVLDCPPEILVEVLNASIPFELMGEFNHLFLTNLETHSSNIADLRDNSLFAVNVTAARLMLNGNFYVRIFYPLMKGNVNVEEMLKRNKGRVILSGMPAFRCIYPSANEWQLASLYNYDPNSSELPRTLLPDLIYDAISLFVSAIRNVTQFNSINTPRITCEFGTHGTSKSWAMGRYITQVMKLTSGVNNTNFRSSNLQFDEDGQRVNFNIEIYKPLKNFAVAYWDTKGHITPALGDAQADERIVYRVATRLGPPYFMINETAASLNITGNGLYKGYAADLIEAIAQEMGFEYVFVPVPDNEYGNENKETKQWNGIIGQLINNDAHMGICDLTITQARKRVVDFTVPFMQLGISILGYKIPTETKSALAFLEPFVVDVWVYVLIAIFIMIFLLVFVARISKEEWENPHPCNKNVDVVENKWHLQNALWLTLGSIMTAGSDILPRSPPMRTLNGMWWIFAIIIANSYTANLAAFLTNSKIQGSIKDIKDLSEQTEVTFGTIYGASTYNFFAESNETTYRLAFNIMNSQDPSAYTKDNDEGVQRVIKNTGSYMFLMETTTLEYNVARNPLLRNVGEKFGEKHYAIAVPFGAEYRSNLSVAILKLSEHGFLFMLKNKWWKDPNATEESVEEEGDDSTPEMNLVEVRGIFYTLVIGILLAIIIGFSEFAMHVQTIALEEKISFKEAFHSELKFVLNIWNNKKPIRGTPTASFRSSSRMSSERTPKTLRKSSFGEIDLFEELNELPRKQSNENSNFVHEVNV